MTAFGPSMWTRTPFTICRRQGCSKNRDDARNAEQAKAAVEQRKTDRLADRERRNRGKLVKSCGGWIGAGALVCVTYLLGPAAVIISATACFGAACFKLGGYFRKEKTK